MDFKIDELDSKQFYTEMHLHATEHPHIYLQWLQVRMLDKLNAEVAEMKKAIQDLAAKQ